MVCQLLLCLLLHCLNQEGILIIKNCITSIFFLYRAEFSFLKSLLDPEEHNPEINVTMLAKTLHKYSESQKSKVDLDER